MGLVKKARRVYPSDHQAALNKLHVGLSDNRDRAEETLGSETSGLVSDRTRLKKRSEASRYSSRNGDDSAGPSDGDATVRSLVEFSLKLGHVRVDVR